MPQPDTQAALDVLRERFRQRTEEGWSLERDDTYINGEMADAAQCYIENSGTETPPILWPWDRRWWKPRSDRENLVRAGALIIAEIERIDRAAAREAADAA